METQPAVASVSLQSQMNAFYGNPNLSQETTVAVFHGANTPEVYTSQPIEQPEPQADEFGTASPNPVETYFSQTTEQLEISEQAAALQQQGSEASAPQAAANNAIDEGSAATPPDENQFQAESPQNVAPEINETRPAAPTPEREPANPEPDAVSTLNSPQTSASSSTQAPKNSPLQQSYAQFGDGGPAASRASQPGAIFSAMG
ncbi:MAG: hypothetical protein J7L25_05435 [Deltaproteobacteria bacterium]|nr:hypothetical protein [Candidatus Tharpella aukensis]